jgi:hypothetical protein
MDRIFKKNKGKNQHINDNGSSSTSSGISEELDLTANSPTTKSEAEEHARPSSWPKLPELALTTSHDAYTYLPVDVPNSPSLSTSSSGVLLNDLPYPDSHHHGPDSNNQRKSMLSEENQILNTDAESESGTEVNEDASEHKRSSRAAYDENDGHSSPKALSQLASLNNDHHKTGFALDDSAASTLVEAAMDKEEAKDRHVRFHDHVAESAALVQRMLSVKSGQHHDPLGAMMQNRHDNRHEEEEEEIELDSPHSNTGGGSVLASLMKLEAKRQDSQIKKKKKTKRNSKVQLLTYDAYCY